MLYPRYIDRSLYTDCHLYNDISARMRAFRLAKMIGEYWSSKEVCNYYNISSTLEQLIDINLYEPDPLPLTWNKLNFSQSFSILS
jgi:hypothetical protein